MNTNDVVIIRSREKLNLGVITRVDCDCCLISIFDLSSLKEKVPPELLEFPLAQLRPLGEGRWHIRDD